MKWRFRPIWLKSPFCFAYFAEKFDCLWKSLFQRFSGGFCLTCIVKNNVKSLCSFCIFIITFDVGKNWISCFCTGEFIKIYLSTLILAIFVQRQQRNVFLLFYWKYGQNCTFDLSVIVQRECNGVVTLRRSVSAVQSAGSTVAGCTGSVFEFITHLIILTLYSLSFHFNR